MKPSLVILDVETVGQPEATIRASLPPFDPESVALGNLRDPDKITAKLAEARLTHGDRAVADAALHPEHGTLAIIGFLARGDSAPSQFCADNFSEAHMLEGAWEQLQRCYTDSITVAAFNGKGFDLPFLVKRSWILGIPVPRSVFNPCKPRYPWGENIVDLMEVWAIGTYGDKYASLDTVLRTLGLPQKTGNGRDFPLLWQKDKAAAKAYNADDLARELAVAERLLP